MLERKYFSCEDFGYITHNCKNRGDIKENKRVEIEEPECQFSSNKFEVLICKTI